ncbi:ATPase [bacterium]|nr:ATPase [bacterium]
MPRPLIHRIREAINLRLYDHKELVIRVLRIASLLISAIAVATLIYYYGFKLEPHQHRWVGWIIRSSLGFYVLKYAVRIVYDFHPLQFLRATWIEGLLMFLIGLNALIYWLFDLRMIEGIGRVLGIQALGDFLMLFLQIYLLVIVVIETGKAGVFLPRINLSPPKLLLLSFLLLIGAGTGLLCLPEMTQSGVSAPLSDALFTSISASCVTGLSTVDVSTYFSFKGHLIILLLIQLGGLNIVTFASLFALFTKGGIGIKHNSILQDNWSGDSMSQTERLVRQLFAFSLIIELGGALALYLSWGPIGFDSVGDRIFHSIFHSVSAFNNAGFSLYTNGLAENGISSLFTLHLFIAGLIILGSTGFPVMEDLLTLRKLRERISKPWLHLKVHTKIALKTTAWLLMVGMILFTVFEWNHSLRGFSGGSAWSHAFFQSVTTRTAGFNTLNVAEFQTPTLLMFLVLMFIGASPGGTGGGIKTTTFALILMSAWAIIRNQERIEIYRSTLPFELLHKAFAVFLFSLTLIFISTIGLSLTDPNQPILDLVFEEVSAYCTVGLSTGITASLSHAGKAILMMSMFVGRVGTLTLVFALGAPTISNDYRFPKANVLVG